jgi:2,5-diketo-D-gluconate reductase A
MEKALKFNDGIAFPLLGLGVMQIPDDDVPARIREAAAIGYRAFDTAPVYGNEPGTGRGIRECGLPRDQVSVTTKLWNAYHAYDDALRACDASLERLGLDYIDVYLIHWPVPAQSKYVEAWKALVRLREEGKVRSIGVSNFLGQHLTEIIDATGVVPVMNQVECHPSWQRRDLRAVHDRLGIVTEAWSPLGRGGTLTDPKVTAIADRLGVSTARLVLAWLMRQNVVVVPKASSLPHLEDNFAALDLALDAESMAALDALDAADGSMGPDPLTFNVTRDPFARRED